MSDAEHLLALCHDEDLFSLHQKRSKHVKRSDTAFSTQNNRTSTSSTKIAQLSLSLFHIAILLIRAISIQHIVSPHLIDQLASHAADDPSASLRYEIAICVPNDATSEQPE
ncbi:hypothetical protein M7I_4585 [Glarea lozoyensis 74030]|uniref:Uncharacterized protein n=1 Tax=Glarea lozoyensis (strain ATCC 74030 / MF5533) TaxID=1104152 RepID=H0EPK4_GLAL7|nr:hypothetical protein M7I_4585 [Glarea lozoyensis 74030]